MNLIIGNTSQLVPYFQQRDPSIMAVSSRNFDQKALAGQFFDRVFLTFGEHRTYADIAMSEYIRVNVLYTAEVIEKIKHQCNTIVVYITSDLWNAWSGPIDLNTPVYYHESRYCLSKEALQEHMLFERQKQGLDIILLYPFNCNSPFRKPKFLFSKFLSLIKYKEPIIVGPMDFSRDLVHPKILAAASLTVTEDAIIGSGVLTNMREFYRNILAHFNMDYDEYVTEDKTIFPNGRNEFFLKTEHPYTTLLDDTIHDIEKYLENERKLLG